MTMKYVNHCILALGMACLVLVPMPMPAQTGQGTIVGTISDSTGAILPNVTVRAVNIQTGFAYGSQSNEEGIYRILYVNPGTYDINYEAQGFKKLLRSGVLVRATETARV